MGKEHLKLDYGKVANCLVKGLGNYFSKNNSKTAIIGLSGGIDSSVACALAARALGNKNVMGVLIPSGITASKDIEDALSVAKQLHIRHIRIDIADLTDSIRSLLRVKGLRDSDAVDGGNISARLRMLILYNIARRTNGLVVGTGDKSESFVGYFTKYGDGGVDILPLGDLYKTQVRELGKELGIPQRIIKKPSSPNLWPNQTAEGELGLTYDVLDQILYYLLEKGYGKKKLIESGFDEDIVNKIIKMNLKSEHKRDFPPILRWQSSERKKYCIREWVPK